MLYVLHSIIRLGERVSVVASSDQLNSLLVTRGAQLYIAHAADCVCPVHALLQLAHQLCENWLVS